MALVAAEPPSCSLIPTCSLLLAPSMTYYCAPCSVGDLLLVFLCLRLFIVTSRGNLVKETTRQILLFFGVILRKSLVSIWFWLTHTWLANKPGKHSPQPFYLGSTMCVYVCVTSNSWQSWPSVVAYISGLICNDMCIKCMFPMHRKRGALGISWMNWVVCSVSKSRCSNQSTKKHMKECWKRTVHCVHKETLK